MFIFSSLLVLDAHLRVVTRIRFKLKKPLFPFRSLLLLAKINKARLQEAFEFFQSLSHLEVKA